MPVCSIIGKQTNWRLSPVGTLLLRKLFLRFDGSNCITPATALKAPLSSGHSSGILRHLSVTPNFQIFAKLTSLISKLAVEPDVPERPLEHKLASEADSKLEELHKEIVTGSSSQFLEEYNKDLSTLVKQVKPLPKEVSKSNLIGMAKRTYKKRERTQKAQQKLRFFQIDKPNRSTVTSHFKDTYAFLQSIDVPCDELQYFPDIQGMTQEVILMCIERLKTYGIHKVFSLLLIQRALAEMKIGISPSNPAKMLDDRITVPHLKQVRLYLGLCQMLERPDLDIISLLDMLIEANGYESMATLHLKVEKLLSIGATADIIWDNLELLTMSRALFDKKIKLYQQSHLMLNSHFPVALFLSKSFQKFEKGLNVRWEALDIAKMLDVSLEEFQACWGFMQLTLPALVQKVRLCIKVGIPKKDVFNNLSLLNPISLEKCYEVTTHFQESGLPASIFIFKEMDQANGINNSHLLGNSAVFGGDGAQRWQTEGGASSVDVAGTNTFSLDWIGKQRLEPFSSADIKTKPSPSPKSFAKANDKKKQVNLVLTGKNVPISPASSTASSLAAGSPKKMASPKSKKSKVQNTTESSKRNRRVLFHFVGHLLSLQPEVLSAMFRCCLSTTSVHRLDVTRNLDFLLLPVASGGGGFTLEQVAQCPLILVHPHTQLKSVLRAAQKTVDSYLASYSSSPSLATTSSSPSHWDGFDEHDEEYEAEHLESAIKPLDESVFRDSPSDPYRPLSSLSSSAFLSTSLSKSSTTSVPYSTFLSTSTLSGTDEIINDDANMCPSNAVFSAAKTTDPTFLKNYVFSCPVRHLNLLQYLLEKESSFSLGVLGAHTFSGFLNRPL